MRNELHYRSCRSRRGSALALTVLCLTMLAALCAALLTVGHATSNERRAEAQRTHARYVCQAGLSQAVYQMHRGEDPSVGSREEPAAWGASRYWVESESPSTDIIRIRATGLDDRAGASMELVARRVPNTIWRYGAFGRDYLHMDSNARVDSYDSRLGTYAVQAVHGSGSTAYANSDGNVGSNGDVLLDQNAKVWGDAIAGPDHDTTVLGNAIVSGSTAPASAQIELPAIVVPAYSSFGALMVSANSALPASNRSYSSLTVGNNRTLTINGPANFVVGSLTLRSGSRIVVNATNGPVTLYVLDNFVMNSNTQIASTESRPQDVTLNLLSDNVINPDVHVQLDQVDFDSNSRIFGTIYAPSAAVTFDSNFELYGAIMARSIDIASNSRFHYDEALLDVTASGPPTYETICWRDIALQE